MSLLGRNGSLPCLTLTEDLISLIMLSTNQFKLCISSFEFSLLFDSCRHSCPSCGSYFDHICGSEVRISSVLVLLGIGSYLWYKYMLRKIRQAKEALKLQQEQIKTSCHLWKDLPVSNNILSSAQVTSLTRQEQARETSQHDFSVVTDQATETSSIQRSLSLSSSSANESVIGESTVAKLDVLLGHIEDIKKSVIEMDADLVYVQNSAKKASHKMLSQPTSGFNYGINEVSSFYLTTDVSSTPPTPTLEWDSNDINDLVMSRSNIANSFSYQLQGESFTEDVKVTNDIFNSDDETTTSTLYLSANDSLCNSTSHQLQLQLIPYASNDPSSDGLRSPSPSSSSGQGSDLPSPEELLSSGQVVAAKSFRIAKVDEILKEIKRLGIANDLLNELLKQVKRDSAYFEE